MGLIITAVWLQQPEGENQNSTTMNRKHQVLVNGPMSDVKVSNTGLPKGLCFIPFLIVCTDSCRSHKESSHLVKLSDDTVLLTLLQGSESDHGCCLFTVVTKIDLNMNETKELIIDLSKK